MLLVGGCLLLLTYVTRRKTGMSGFWDELLQDSSAAQENTSYITANRPGKMVEVPMFLQLRKKKADRSEYVTKDESEGSWL